ncbi:MAG: PAS domain S-box protein [Sandaracinaceae bacterium]|nr:PAS domain S-box protein [Sandaracinaceae bacterium]
MSDVSREQRRVPEIARAPHPSTEDATHLVSEDGRFLEVDEAACRLFGYSRDELLRLRVGDVDLAFDAHHWPSQWATLRARGLVRFESVGRHRDGSSFPIEVTADLVEHQGLLVARSIVRDLRTQRGAERRLSESEGRFRALFEQAIDGLMRTTLDGTILEANDALAHIVGLRHGRELVGTNVERFYAPPERRQELLAGSEGSERLHAQLWWKRRGGDRVRVELVGRREVTADGFVFSTFVRDVTLAHRQEQVLRALSDLSHGRGGEPLTRFGERLSQVLDQEARGVAIVRGRGGRRRVTHAWLDTVPVAPPTWPALPDDESAEALASALGVLDGAHVSVPIRDGGQEHGLILALGLGTPRVVALVRDAVAAFAERLAGELERMRDAERFAAIFEHAPNAVVIVTPEHLVVTANRRAAELLGRPREELHGAPLQPFLERPRDDDRGVLYVHRGSDRIPVEISESVLHDDEDELRVLALLDVSERVARDEARSRLEAELRRQQRIEALGTLAGGIAHDFNNLLAAILANAELAVASPVESGQAIDEIRRASHRGRELVGRILAFSRRQRSTRVVAALGPVLTEVERLVRASLTPGVDIELDIRDPSISARIDVTQIHQVVLNLVTNAWHAISPRGGTIRLSLDAVEASFARIRVADDGCGMTPEVQDRIFEPFFTTRPIGEGTGLGLSVAHGIVVDHDGQIRVSSIPGRGSSFEVLLPRVAPEPPTVPAPTTERPAQPVRVLLVDDEWSLVRPITRLLEREGYLVRAFSSPTAAMEAFFESPEAYDVVVSDLHMPDLDGVSLVERVRARRPSMPAILVSGNHDLEPARALPDVVRLDKPFRPGELVDALVRALAPR